MDLMDKEHTLNNYIDIIKAHIEGKTILFKDRIIINEEWHKVPDDFINFNFDYFEYKTIPEYVPFESCKEVVKNIKGRMVKNNIFVVYKIKFRIILFNFTPNTHISIIVNISTIYGFSSKISIEDMNIMFEFFSCSFIYCLVYFFHSLFF